MLIYLSIAIQKKNNPNNVITNYQLLLLAKL